VSLAALPANPVCREGELQHIFPGPGAWDFLGCGSCPSEVAPILVQYTASGYPDCQWHGVARGIHSWSPGDPAAYDRIAPIWHLIHDHITLLQ